MKTLANKMFLLLSSKHIFRRPKVPEISGLEDFPGKVKTAAEFRKGEVFSNQNVLVIGLN